MRLCVFIDDLLFVDSDLAFLSNVSTEELQ